jgi:hypothetical protein
LNVEGFGHNGTFPATPIVHHRENANEFTCVAIFISGLGREIGGGEFTNAARREQNRPVPVLMLIIALFLIIPSC